MWVQHAVGHPANGELERISCLEDRFNLRKVAGFLSLVRQYTQLRCAGFAKPGKLLLKAFQIPGQRMSPQFAASAAL
jgi:hypothetical protein